MIIGTLLYMYDNIEVSLHDGGVTQTCSWMACSPRQLIFLGLVLLI